MPMKPSDSGPESSHRMTRNETSVATALEHAEQERHRVLAEDTQVLGDALVGVVDRALQLDAVVAAAVSQCAR